MIEETRWIASSWQVLYEVTFVKSDDFESYEPYVLLTPTLRILRVGLRIPCTDVPYTGYIIWE